MPVTAAPRASARTRTAPSSVPTPTARVTRLRSAKEGAASPARLGTQKPQPTGLLAKSKEGLRKVSDKIKEKEKEAKEARAKAAAVPDNTYTQSLQSFLRIRPPPSDAAGRAPQPYLEPQDGKSVLMRPPADPNRPNVPKQAHVYSFDRVFNPDTTQNAFFETTTLPLVDKLLKGENGLLFAYGVSNSGKSYTIQGGNGAGLEERGVLPRSIDVVFNSIEGHESKANLKCQGLADVVLTDDDDGIDLSALPLESEPQIDHSIKVDRNFSYAVFVSYVEVYNDKIFDLLDSALPSTRPRAYANPMARTTSMGLSGGFGTSMNLAAMANGGTGVLKRRALALKNDPEGSGKYIAGLHEIRVRTRQEALAVFRCGQRARQVFGTMANRESSRSHGIFTLKVVRVHNGAPEDPDSAQVSRLAIVDLAGSERTRNTATTGDRLKEAGNINKSLMVLGQCLEVLRANQQKSAAQTPAGTRKRLAVVPFRHSKLTEIFQNFFVGDGRAVMMIHVNPYDTGFDENSHVMRFSAVAREIQTTATHKTSIPTLKRQISTHLSNIKDHLRGGQRIKVVVPVIPQQPPTASTSRPPSRPTSAAGTRRPPPPVVPVRTSSRTIRSPTPLEDIKLVEEELEVVEEDPEDESDDEQDMLVDYLFEQLRELKTQLYESEMRNASLEVDIREEVGRDMHETIQRMHTEFNRRLQAQMASGEEKADMKLDILQRTMAPEDDSFDESFASALDESMTESAGDTSTLSDPFGPAPVRRDQTFSTEGDSEDEVSEIMSEVGDLETELAGDLMELSIDDVNESEQEEMAPVAGNRAAMEVEDEDEEESEEEEEVEELEEKEQPTPRITITNFVDDEAEESLEEEEEEEEATDPLDDSGFYDAGEIVGSDEEEEQEEDEEDEGEADEDEDDSDEDFDESFASASTESAQSPPRRGSRMPAASPVKKSATQPKAPVAKSRAPLRESLKQATVYNEDEDLVKDPTTPKKKKRALGKRIVTEDDMDARDRPVGGAEVKRMTVRGL